MDFKLDWRYEASIGKRISAHAGNFLEGQMPIATHKPLYNGPVVVNRQVLRSDLLHVKGHGHAQGVSTPHGSRVLLGVRTRSVSSRTRLRKARKAFL